MVHKQGHGRTVGRITEDEVADPRRPRRRTLVTDSAELVVVGRSVVPHFRFVRAARARSRERCIHESLMHVESDTRGCPQRHRFPTERRQQGEHCRPVGC